MGNVSREDVLQIANSINAQFHMDISERCNVEWPPHVAEMVANCWYVKFSATLEGLATGTGFLLAISKDSGSILYSGMLNE